MRLCLLSSYMDRKWLKTQIQKGFSEVSQHVLLVLFNPIDSYSERSLFRMESHKVKVYNNFLILS